MLHSEKGTPCGRCQLLSFQRLEQLGDQGKTAFEPLIIHQKPSWIHFWIHCVRDVSPSLKFQRFQNCEFVRFPPSAPRIGPGRQLPGPLLLLDFVEISTCSASSLPAAQRRKTLHKPTRLEEFRGMHWGYISIGEVIFP